MKSRVMNNSPCDAQVKNSSSTALQMEDPLYSALFANIVFNYFLCYTTTMLNIVTIHAVRKTSSLPKPLRSLLLSLAVSDLGIGLLGQPLYIANNGYHVKCNFSNQGILFVPTQVVLNISCISSFLNIMALSADRFLAIQKPLRYETMVTYRRVIIVVASIWLFSTFFTLCMTFVFPRALAVTIVTFVILYSICFVATTWSSYKTYSTVRYHRMQIQAQTQQVAQNSEMVNIASLSKSAQSTFCIYLAFWVCYLPNFFIAIARYRDRSTILSTLNEFAWTLVFLNSSLNPVIYCWKMRHIRHSVMGILRNIFRR